MRKAVVVLAFLAGCGEAPPPDIGVARAEVELLIKGYHEKLSAGDLDGVAPMIDAECSFVFGSSEPVQGREAVLANLKGFIDFHRANDMIGKRPARFGEIRMRLSGALMLATYSVVFMQPKGPHEESYTQLFRRSEGRWLLTHEHRCPKK